MSRAILLLGTPRIEENHRLIPVDRRKALALLAYLVVTRQAQPREALAALLFPDADSSRALAYVRNALWTLNKALGDSWAVLEDETVRFNTDAGIEDDVSRFRALLVASGNDKAGCIDGLTQAVALYRSDFMAGFTLEDCPDFEEWRFFQAETLKREYAGTLERLTHELAEARDYDGALKTARRWLALDSLNEPAHRRLMHLYAVTGQHAAAVRQYQELGRLLDTELQAQPDMESQALYEAIQARRVPQRVVAGAGAEHVPVNGGQNGTNGHAGGQVILPPQTTPFVGREWELGEINRLLSQPECRLLTLTGPGGIGKTRLAVRAAADMAASYPDGVYFVSLTPVCYCEYVAPTIANALSFVSVPAEDAEGQLMECLEPKKLLLVLDNFEHLIESANLLTKILAYAPQVNILVTSRERLNLQEEWLLETGGLHFPLTADESNPQDYPAVRLFLQSAVRVRRDFSPADMAAITHICHLVGGMPLALELAATWVQVLPVEQIATEIQRSVDFLATNMRNVPERHRSLRAVFEYSWERLTPDEQTALNRLSVFRGGFEPEAAQAIAGASLPVLLTLVEKSLLRRNPFGAPGRFEMHELLRQYAEQKLDDAERHHNLHQHSQYYLDWLHRLNVALCSADEPRALDAIQQDLDNVRGAVRYAVEHHLAVALNRAFPALRAFYITRVHIEESCELLDRIARGLRDDSTVPEERLLLGQVLTAQASTYHAQGQAENREQCITRAMPLLREFPDDPNAALALMWLGLAKNIPGRKYPLAKELAQEGLAKSEALGYRYGVAFGLYAIGMIEHVQVEYAAARAHVEQSLELFREIGQPGAIAMVLSMLIETAMTRGDYAEAHTFAEEACGLMELTGNRLRLALVKGYILESLAAQKPTGEKIEIVEGNLRLFQEAGERSLIVWTKYNLVWLYYERGRLDEALQLQQQILPEFRRMKDLEGELWTLNMGAMIQLAAGKTDLARQAANESLTVKGSTPFPWAESGAYFALGEIAFEEGSLVEARAMYRKAVQIAFEVDSILQTLRHLIGFVVLAIREEAPEDAAALATFINEHPASHHDVLVRSASLLEWLEKHVSPEAFTGAQARGRQFTLEQVVQAFAG